MVLNDLGKKINAAFQSLTSATSVDEQMLDAVLKEICKALLESDVNVRLVQTLRKNVKAGVNLSALPAGVNKKKIIQKAVFDELCTLVDPGQLAYVPERGRPNIIMFVGLQGSGKTTSCTKFAHYYQRRGWKTCLVCADTFRAGAFDQLKQNALKAKIPFYGSYVESDPVQLAMNGVEKFKQEGFEIIIVDTSGRHKQEGNLFEEMKQIERVIEPDNVVFVLDGAIGQAAEAQAKAFSEAVRVGSIIITKMDGHAKGGGAISAVAATRSPIIFIGTGEHIYDLDQFSAKSFIGKMLGMGDLQGLMNTVQDLNLEKGQEEMMKRIVQGQFSLRDYHEQFQTITQLGPLSKIMGMIPGMSADMFPQGHEEDTQQFVKKTLRILDSMTQKELDGDGKVFINEPTRVIRIAIGSGCIPEEVEMVFKSYRTMSEMVKKMGGKNGFLSAMGGGAGGGGGRGGMPGMGGPGGLANMMNPGRMNPQQLARMQQQMRQMNPNLMRQLGNMGGGNLNIDQMLQSFGNMFGS